MGYLRLLKGLHKTYLKDYLRVSKTNIKGYIKLFKGLHKEITWAYLSYMILKGYLGDYSTFN
jgi:hypothetical protein